MDGKERRAVSDLGRRARETREARGWTQEDAAERLGIGVRELQRIEAGDTNLTLRSLLRLARALGVPPGSLFEPPTNRRARKPGRPRTS